MVGESDRENRDSVDMVSDHVSLNSTIIFIAVTMLSSLTPMLFHNGIE
jgi:hypothetical protein